MLAFDVSINGKKRCVAGVASDESLTVVAAIAPAGPFFAVNGSTGPNGDFAKWIDSERLNLADEIIIRLVDVPRVDEPSTVTKTSPQSAPQE